MKFKKTILAISLISLSTTALATSLNLNQVYQLALKNDASYKASIAAFKAAKTGVPVAAATLLPNITVTANSAVNKSSLITTGRYNSHGYTATATQQLLDPVDYRTYKQSKAVVAAAKITLEQAKQTLIVSTITSYFNILKDQDNLRYAEANQASLKQQMTQAEQKYKVGLAAMTDVQAARAQYESAVAASVSASNSLQNDKESLQKLTKTPINNIAPLKNNFALNKPNPANPNAWVKTAMQYNLTLKADKAQGAIDVFSVGIQKAGYWPTATLSGAVAGSKANSSSSAEFTTTSVVRLSASYNIFSGGSTVAGVNNAKMTKQADTDTLFANQRSVKSLVKQDYLNILTDISLIQAYKQSVISATSSLKATMAGYSVGTETIFNVLFQQKNLFKSQQNYADSKYSYIMSMVSLEKDTGILNDNDIVMINKLLS